MNRLEFVWPIYQLNLGFAKRISHEEISWLNKNAPWSLRYDFKIWYNFFNFPIIHKPGLASFKKINVCKCQLGTNGVLYWQPKTKTNIPLLVQIIILKVMFGYIVWGLVTYFLTKHDPYKKGHKQVQSIDRIFQGIFFRHIFSIYYKYIIFFNHSF